MSSKDMTITEIKNTSKSFADTHTIKVSGFKDSGKKPTISDVLKEMRAGFQQINNRIDNLISKNNLKE